MGCEFFAPGFEEDSEPEMDVSYLNQRLDTSEVSEVFHSRRQKVGDLDFHYVEGGDGPPVMFLHGFPSYWFMWHEQLRALVTNHRVIAPDLLGVNLSAKPDDLSSYHIEQLVAQVHGLIESLVPDQQIVLVGHDWGGALAWAYAQAHPERLRGLVVLSAPPLNLFLELLATDPDQQEASKYVERIKKAGDRPLGARAALLMWQRAYEPLIERGKLSEEEGRYLLQALSQPGALNGAMRWYQANVPEPQQIKDQDFWPTRLASTEVPSLLLWGEADRTFVPAFLERLPAYAPGVRIERLPGVGHWPGLEEPERVNELLREFLQ